ncbi:MAG: HAD-IC family P-type ATPase [bacterium]|nr:HAD-IC family P-type ATPase [bacterium]
MKFSQYTAKTGEEILKELGTEELGLSSQEVIRRQKEFGFNEVSGNEVYWWKVLIRQFKSAFLYLLLVAAILSFLLGQAMDGWMILLFVGLNTFLSFYQEYRSESTLKMLKQYVISKAKVYRGGKETIISSQELVPGDILALELGDIVPADVRFLKAQNLMIDESSLTGESAPAKKMAENLSREVKEIYQAENIGFSGTIVTDGEGMGVVLGTGQNTAIGEIASLVAGDKRTSSFEKGIGQFSQFILRLIIITLVFVVLANIVLKGTAVNIPTLFIFAIALAVSVIPEALPVVMTFSLSRGALHLAKNKVVVKRLSAVEDLGSIEILCTDKTGTITENKLTVDEIYENHKLTLFYACLANSSFFQKEANNSFDAALWQALSAQQRKKLTRYQRLKEIPFDPEKRRNSVVVKNGASYELVVRGAPESIIQLCLSSSQKESHSLSDWILSHGEKGKRIIAVAKKRLSAQNIEAGEKDLDFVGLVSFTDPLKKTTDEAVLKAESLGLKIKILTGDSREVAGHVAQTIGLIKTPGAVIIGEEFDKLSPEKQHQAVDDFSVFARVSPQQKHLIIQLLEEKYEVGFLGEGINDVPALKIANVAIAVKGAADIAREAADIVLLNKSLNVIVDGIKEGREIFANTTKYIRATLASNFGNFYTVAVVSLFINFLPLLPLQILLINLLTDFPLIAVATDNVDKEELRRPRSYDIKEIVLIATILGVVSTVFDFIFFALFYRISPAVLQTNWFIGSVLTELIFLFSIRTRFSVFKAKPPSNILLYLTSLAFVTAIILPFTSFGQQVFSFIRPNLNHLYLILVVVVLYFVTTESVKLLYYRYSNRS